MELFKDKFPPTVELAVDKIMPALLFAWEGKVVDNARLDSTIIQNLMGMSNLGQKEWPLWAITGAIMWKEGTRTSH